MHGDTTVGFEVMPSNVKYVHKALTHILRLILVLDLAKRKERTTCTPVLVLDLASRKDGRARRERKATIPPAFQKQSVIFVHPHQFTNRVL